MEIRIADNWNWLTIDRNGSTWAWEGKPGYEDDSGTWEMEIEGDSGWISSILCFAFGDDIQDAKDKIWKRNGEDWEYAGGQVSKELGHGCLFDNMEAVFDFLGFGLLSYEIAPEEESTCNWNFFVKQRSDTLRCGIALKAIKLVRLIKDAEGGKDEN